MYPSIDIDVLDPAYTPGTGTPESGGLSSRELLEVVRGLADLNVVGADVVEVVHPIACAPRPGRSLRPGRAPSRG
ncbi:arginase family protein [Saccharopolyspora spinosa]|uniref:Arginase family protein n=1 Tax=Saccharopolyspora spinosa TaxID=60894 RepID=A0A2N3Y9M9_SACSN|nr:arginase family protein [Saccharopolyspora spinosa]